MIGVVVPAHNEEALLGRCLASLRAAACHPDLAGESVLIVVVLDACNDDSERIAREGGALTLHTDARNVGMARHLGAEYIIAQGARWLACTDADSHVAEDWLVEQLRHEAEVVCGTVQVQDWENYDADVQQAYHQRYQPQNDHRHVHGANLGICTQAYQRAGGFPPIPAHEDVQLVEALTRNGARIVWSGSNSVNTSARREPRARGGFGDYLVQLAASITGNPA